MTTEYRLLGIEDFLLAAGGTGAVETAVSAFGVPSSKMDAKHLKLRGAPGLSVEDELLLRSQKVLNVKNYGVLGNDTDETAAIANAMSIVSSQGFRSVYFPAGTYRTLSTITLPVSMRLFGDFSGNTVFKCPNSVDIVYTNQPYSEIFGIKFMYVGGSAATAGAGVRTGTLSQATHVHDCLFYYTYDGAVINNTIPAFSHNVIGWPERYGLLLGDGGVTGDSGDAFVQFNTFDGFSGGYKGVAAIQAESGGGTKIIGNKVLGFQYAVRNYAMSTTSILIIANNSFEHPSSGHIYIHRNGANTWNGINISHNILDSSFVVADAIRINDAHTWVVIEGNNIAGFLGSQGTNGVYLNAVDRAVVASNLIAGYTNGVYALNCTNSLFGPNKIVGATTPYNISGGSGNERVNPVPA